MKISSRSRYGLRAMVDIASHGEDEPESVSAIAERQQISEAYLEQLAARLKKAGLLKSSRGSQGGYTLAREAGSISVGDVIRALEGDLDAAYCPALTGEGCSGAGSCVTKYVWQKVNESIAKTVDSIFLDTLVEESMRMEESAGIESGEAES